MCSHAPPPPLVIMQSYTLIWRCWCMNIEHPAISLLTVFCDKFCKIFLDWNVLEWQKRMRYLNIYQPIKCYVMRKNIHRVCVNKQTKRTQTRNVRHTHKTCYIRLFYNSAVLLCLCLLLIIGPREGTKYQSPPTCSGKCDSLVSRSHEVTGHTLEMICDDHTGVTIMQHSRPVIVSRHQLFLV